MSAITNVNAGAAVISIVADNEKLNSSLGKSKNALHNFATAAAEIGKKFAIVGTAFTAPFANAARVFADFDDKMRTVAAVSGSTGAAFQALTEQAKQLGATTAFTASQVASGMAALGRMGFDSTEIQAATPHMMDLAQSTGTDLAQAAEIASNNMRVFGLSASQTQKVADLLAATANGSAQTLTDLGEALKTAGPSANQAGASLESTVASLGVLANMGIKGAMAGTALSKSYKRMADSKIQDFLAGFGIKVTNANGNLRDMARILADIGVKMSSMSNSQQITFINEVFEARGALGGGLLSANAQAIEDFMSKLEQANGYAHEAAQGMEGGLGGALRNLSSAFEGVSIAVGEAINGALVPLVKSISDAAREFAAWGKEHPILVRTIGGVSVAFLALGTSLSALGMIVSTASASVSGLVAVYHALTGSQTANAASTNALVVSQTANVSSANSLAVSQQAHNASVLACTRLLPMIVGQTTILSQAEMALFTIIQRVNAAMVARVKLLSAVSGQTRLLSLSENAASLSGEGLAASNAVIDIQVTKLTPELGALTTGMTATGAASTTAAAGVGFFGKALALITAHPVIAAITAVTAALVGLAIAYGKVLDKRASLMEQRTRSSWTEQDKAIADNRASREAIQTRDETDLATLRKLSSTSAERKLTGKEMNEAALAIQHLTEHGYKALPVLDTVSGRLSEIGDEAKKAAEKTAEANRFSDMRANIHDVQKELERTQKEIFKITNSTGFGKYTANSYSNKVYEDLEKRRAALQQQLLELQKERDQAQRDKANKEAREAEQRQAELALAANAAQKVIEETENAIAEKNLSPLDKELQKVWELEDAYVDALEKKIAFEESRPNRNESLIDELYKKLRGSADLFQRMEDAATEKYYKSQGIRDLDEEEAASTAKSKRSNFLNVQNSFLDALQKVDPDKYNEQLNSYLVIASAQQAAAKKAYNDAVKAAKSSDSDGGTAISDDEKAKLASLYQSFSDSQKRFLELQTRANAVQDKLDNSTEQTSNSYSTFYAALVGDESTEVQTARKTLKAAEDSAKTLENIKTWLEDNGDNGII